jgi:hypothetical protein
VAREYDGCNRSNREQEADNGEKRSKLENQPLVAVVAVVISGS